MSHLEAVIWAGIVFAVGIILLVRAITHIVRDALDARAEAGGKVVRPDDAWYARPGYFKALHAAEQAAAGGRYPDEYLHDEFQTLTEQTLTAYESDPLMAMIKSPIPHVRALACRMAAFSTEPYYTESLIRCLEEDDVDAVRCYAARALALRVEHAPLAAKALAGTLSRVNGKEVEIATACCAGLVRLCSRQDASSEKRPILDALHTAGRNAPNGTVRRIAATAWRMIDS